MIDQTYLFEDNCADEQGEYKERSKVKIEYDEPDVMYINFMCEEVRRENGATKVTLVDGSNGFVMLNKGEVKRLAALLNLVAEDMDYWQHYHLKQ